MHRGERHTLPPPAFVVTAGIVPHRSHALRAGGGAERRMLASWDAPLARSRKAWNMGCRGTTVLARKGVPPGSKRGAHAGVGPKAPCKQQGRTSVVWLCGGCCTRHAGHVKVRSNPSTIRARMTTPHEEPTGSLAGCVACGTRPAAFARTGLCVAHGAREAPKQTSPLVAEAFGSANPEAAHEGTGIFHLPGELLDTILNGNLCPVGRAMARRTCRAFHDTISRKDTNMKVACTLKDLLSMSVELGFHHVSLYLGGLFPTDYVYDSVATAARTSRGQEFNTSSSFGFVVDVIFPMVAVEESSSEQRFKPVRRLLDAVHKARKEYFERERALVQFLEWSHDGKVKSVAAKKDRVADTIFLIMCTTQTEEMWKEFYGRTVAVQKIYNYAVQNLAAHLSREDFRYDVVTDHYQSAAFALDDTGNQGGEGALGSAWKRCLRAWWSNERRRTEDLARTMALVGHVYRGDLDTATNEWFFSVPSWRESERREMASALLNTAFHLRNHVTPAFVPPILDAFGVTDMRRLFELAGFPNDAPASTYAEDLMRQMQVIRTGKPFERAFMGVEGEGPPREERPEVILRDLDDMYASMGGAPNVGDPPRIPDVHKMAERLLAYMATYLPFSIRTAMFESPTVYNTVRVADVARRMVEEYGKLERVDLLWKLWHGKDAFIPTANDNLRNPKLSAGQLNILKANAALYAKKVGEIVAVESEGAFGPWLSQQKEATIAELKRLQDAATHAEQKRLQDVTL